MTEEKADHCGGTHCSFTFTAAGFRRENGTPCTCVCVYCTRGMTREQKTARIAEAMRRNALERGVTLVTHGNWRNDDF